LSLLLVLLLVMVCVAVAVYVGLSARGPPHPCICNVSGLLSPKQVFS